MSKGKNKPARRMLALATLMLVFGAYMVIAAVPASAAYTGPVAYTSLPVVPTQTITPAIGTPPNDGFEGKTGGQTIQYTGLSPGTYASGQFFWGPWASGAAAPPGGTVPTPRIALDGSTEAAATVLPFRNLGAANEAIWGGTSADMVNMRIASGGGFTNVSLRARYRMIANTTGNVPINWVTSIPAGISGSNIGALLPVTGDFKILRIFEVSPSPFTVWTPAMTFYNAGNNTDPTKQTRMSWVGGFYFNRPPVANNLSPSLNEDTPVGITLTGSDPDVGNTLTFSVLSSPTKGVLSGAAPNLTYTPNLNQNGPDSFTYRTNDGLADSNTATVTININPVNDAPVANPQSVSVNEDNSVGIVLTGSDVEGSALTYVVTVTPLHGTLAGTAPGLTYTPTLNYNGSDSFKFTVNDGALTSPAATVSINVNPLNDAPSANSQAVSTNEDTALAVTLTGSDPDGDTLTFTVQDQPVNGTLSGSGANRTYTPNANYSGSDSFTFVASDNALTSLVATVSITVVPVNDAPVAIDQELSTDEDTPVNITLTGTDVEGDTLLYSVLSGPSNGTLSGTAPNLTYTPDANFFGDDSFTFRVSDGLLNSNVATITIHVPPINDAPVSLDQDVVTDEDTAVSIALGATDVEGDALTFEIVDPPANGSLSGTLPNLTYTPNANNNGTDSFTFKVNDGTEDSNVATVSITINAINDVPVADDQGVMTDEDVPLAIALTGSDVETSTLTFTVVDQPLHGTLTGTAPALTYTPDANYNGDDSFTFTVFDGELVSDLATVSITVNPVNDAPVADAQSLSTDEDTPLSITLGGSDVDGDTLTFDIVTDPSHGTLSGTAPDIVYTPDANYYGSDELVFRVSDGNLTAVATVTITVNPINDAPVAADQSVTTPEDTAVSIALGAEDVDSNLLVFEVVDGPANGSLSGTAPNLVYTPGPDFNGVDAFTFNAFDGELYSNIATVSITITPVNDKPHAHVQGLVTAEDTALNIMLTGSDIDGDSLSYLVVTPPTNGSLTGTEPAMTYEPNANFAGSDSFSFIVSDGILTSDPATIYIRVDGVNDAPVADAQSVTTAEDTAVAILLTGSDTEGSSLTYIVVDPPANGTLTGDAPTLSYEPDLNFNGADSFTFKVNDGDLDSEVATVSISITPVNDAPDAIDDAAEVQQYASVVIEVLANDTDAENDELSVSAVTAPMHGSATINPDGSITYSPNATFKGGDMFNYTASDPSGASDSATVTITELGCSEDGLQALDDGPLDGTASERIDRDVEPVAGGVSPNLALTVHSANCSVVVPTENSIDDALGTSGDASSVAPAKAPVKAPAHAPSAPAPQAPSAPQAPDSPASGGAQTPAVPVNTRYGRD